ncbi:MAG: addiction module toxin, HicA family [Deltaproteobacteria bacterium]|nr:MAG: addiction module toxin, HicA family [Deltaproteobacteria bacterium]
MKIKVIIQMLENDDWYLSRTRGSHRQFKHLNKSGLVTVSGKPNDDIAMGTKNNIFKQAGFKK